MCQANGDSKLFLQHLNEIIPTSKIGDTAEAGEDGEICLVFAQSFCSLFRR